jgi:hypothetical protein
MADPVETETTDETPRKRSFKLTERAGRVARASAEAATEVSVGAVRVAADLVTGVAQSVADNINSTVSDTADLAQRGVDRFFSVLDSARDGDEDEEASGSAKAAHRRGAKRQH